jgi:hypothetical protein
MWGCGDVIQKLGADYQKSGAYCTHQTMEGSPSKNGL